eukprot:jgi/Mesen1/719/ME001096S10748
MTIYTKHEWVGSPSVYFRCQGEDKKELPDIKHTNVEYNFTGLESFQPLTALEGKRCKRCGFFEADKLKPDDVYEEWELCPLNFSPPPAPLHVRYAPRQFNATFRCPECNAADESRPPPSPSIDDLGVEGSAAQRGGDGGGLSTWVIVVIAVCSALVIALVVLGVVRWRQAERWPFRRSKYEDSARFMQLFDEEDDELAELGNNQL